MHLVAFGLNHRTAPVALREQVAVPERRLPEALGALTARHGVAEAVIVSTCNRAELYAAIDTGAAPRGHRATAVERSLEAALASWGGVRDSELAGHTYLFRDEQAAEHLMRVAGGVDSMILGDGQILGQVKTAYETARAAGASGAILNQLFQSALAVGKTVRSQTGIGVGAFSVGSAAVELATRIFGASLAGKTVLVLGAGKMSELTARHLQSRGSPAVLVTNRTFNRAESLAAQLGEGASARRFDDLDHALLTSDIVICSTAAPHPIVTRDLIHAAMRARRNRPLFLVDIAVPRDVDPSVGEMQNVYLYNIDDLTAVVARDHAARSQEVRRAELIIAEAVARFVDWRRGLEAAPLVTAVRERLDSIQLGELARIRARLPHLTEHELRVVSIALRAVTGKIAHDATAAIKSAPIDGESDAAGARLHAIREAFGLGADLHPAAADANARELPQASATPLQPAPAADA